MAPVNAGVAPNDRPKMNCELNSPLLQPYPLEERQAILVHKYFLGIEMGRDPGLDCALRSWEARVAMHWRHQRLKEDCLAQLREIDAHRQLLCMQRGQNTGWEEAARDWVTNHAAAWRANHERQVAASLGG
jgi:hypothetical protein